MLFRSSVLQCVAVWCMCVAVCCSVLQCVAVCCSMLYVAVCCSVLQYVAACCSVSTLLTHASLSYLMSTATHRVAVCCSVVQCVAVCCSVLQCVVVCRDRDTYLSAICHEYCNTPQLSVLYALQQTVLLRTATHCNPRIATHCNTKSLQCFMSLDASTRRKLLIYLFAMTDYIIHGYVGCPRKGQSRTVRVT